MNSYLQISYAVLSKSSSPMTSREILDAAYRLQLVPRHLFGKTQHKTLHARLSEDILQRRASSDFTRTGPGRFALRTKRPPLEDGKRIYLAPRRSYQLKQFDVICADADKLRDALKRAGDFVYFDRISNLFVKQAPLRSVETDQRLDVMRILIVIWHQEKILTLTSQDSVEAGPGRSLGLVGYVKGDDADLFSIESYGIDAAARRTLAEQSTAPKETIEALDRLKESVPFRCFYIGGHDSGAGSLIVLTEFECHDPAVFIDYFPANRVPRWTRVPAEINDLSSLDPISRVLITQLG